MIGCESKKIKKDFNGEDCPFQSRRTYFLFPARTQVPAKRTTCISFCNNQVLILFTSADSKLAISKLGDWFLSIVLLNEIF